MSNFAMPPTFDPTSALPTGESIDSLPSPGSASVARRACSVFMLAGLASSTSTRLPNPTTSRLRLDLAHLGGEQLLADAQDLRLQVRLVVLGVVVLGVLLEVAPLARGLDALGDLAAGDGLELFELGLERGLRLGGHDNGIAQAQHFSPPERNSDAIRRDRTPSSARRRPARAA